jgi:hypothetical protein
MTRAAITIVMYGLIEIRDKGSTIKSSVEPIRFSRKPVGTALKPPAPVRLI